MTRSQLVLKRLRVYSNKLVAYDENFHAGVNIIRGTNGSGKSTIADFIYFALGGEFDGWKDAASLCTEVVAEIEVPDGRATLRRSILSRVAPVQVFFGQMDVALSSAIEMWTQYPLHRSDNNESFSQLLFRLIGFGPKRTVSSNTSSCSGGNSKRDRILAADDECDRKNFQSY